jgi:hypothetical protein
MRYFVSSELGVANLLQRNFDWVSNTLWFEEIPHARDPARTRYFLGGKDEILNAEVRYISFIYLSNKVLTHLFPARQKIPFISWCQERPLV